MMMKKYLVAKVAFFSCVLYLFSSCAKDKYYFDGGLANPNYNGTMLQYLESNKNFDTIARIIKLAGLEKEFNEDDLTFFAPNDYTVRNQIAGLNASLSSVGGDSIRTLDEISPAIWRKTLMAYMFKGSNGLKDYYQLDPDLKAVFPGQYYSSYNGTLANIGVNYADVNGIKYAGYRNIIFSFVPDYNALDTWVSSPVVSHDIKPRNGVVHALDLYHTFGELSFRRDVLVTR
jgi:hypothetical protein